MKFVRTYAMEMMRRFVLYMVLVILAVSCSHSNTIEKNISYSVTSVMPEEIATIADSGNAEYTAICTYQYMCTFCREDFPRMFSFCDTLPIDFYVLFTCRVSDSSYIYESMQAIKKYDTSFDRFLILSDSLYDPENRTRKEFRFFKEYGGPIEGQKYIKYVDSYIPVGFDKGCYTPRLLLYQRGKGIVFASHYDEQEETCLPQHDIEQLVNIIYQNH